MLVVLGTLNAGWAATWLDYLVLSSLLERHYDAIVICTLWQRDDLAIHLILTSYTMEDLCC